MEYIVLIVAVIGCVFCPFWIKNARDTKDRGFGIFSVVINFGGVLLC